MARPEGSMLYDEARVVLARISEVSVSKSPITHVRKRTAEALEHMLDLLDLDTQPEVIASDLGGGTLEVTTSTPLVMLFCEFTMGLENDETLPIEQQVLLSRCTFLASLPDRLTNALCGEAVSLKSLEIDLDLLTTRICQALCRFVFAIHSAVSQESVDVLSSGSGGGRRRMHYRFERKQAALFSKTMLQSLARRGYICTLFQCFIDTVRVALLSAPVLSQEVIPLVFTAIYGCSFRYREMYGARSVKLDSTGRSRHPCWSEWISSFLRTAERNFEIKHPLIGSLIWMLNLPRRDSEVSDEMLSASEALEKELFFVETACLATERGVLRVIFREILPALRPPHTAVSGDSGEVGSLSETEMRIFTEIMHKWGNREFVESGPIEVNNTLANAVLYILLHIKERLDGSENTRLPAVLLKPLLDGVSARFEIVRVVEMRNEALTVASAFASFFVGNEEATRAFSNLDEFPLLLNDWLKSESQSVNTPELQQIPQRRDADDDHHNNTINASTGDDDAGGVSGLAVLRRSVRDEEYPPNPDETFLFFCRRDSAASARPPHTSGVGRLSVYQSHGVVDHAHLPSFGQTVHEQDELEDNARILVTLRESYNAIVGVGRGSNTQMYEVQQATENGLRGFAHVLQKLKEKLGVWREHVVDGDLLRSRERIGRELNPMISSLFPTLMSLNIHAPEARYNELMGLRNSIVVSLISITPEMALSQLSGMLYSSHYGVLQRVEMTKAIGEAAKYLSQIEVRMPSQHGVSKLEEAKRDPGATKRIYPPIQSRSVMPVAITVTEGKETRRWGRAVAERGDKKVKLYTNLLADTVTFFLSALLARAEDDHFAFFRDSDPYAPAEVLRCICIVVRRISSARHVAPSSCKCIFPFALVVATQHPISSIRRQGWILVSEVMRCWCGAGPLVLSDGDNFTTSRGVFGGSLSYVFSEEWLNAQQTLEDVFRRTMKDSCCSDVALLVVADLQDLLYARRSLEAMADRSLNTKSISVATVADDVPCTV